ncbi:MAG: universal stress protein [Halobacteriaceae archaeon]
MKVLLGVGGSPDAIDALDRTIERAAAVEDDLTVAVLSNPESDQSVEAVETLVEERLADAALEARVRRFETEPASRLVTVAEEEGFDEIVLGGGEQSPMGKIRLGHIAEFVVLNASVTVTLVR